MSSTRRGGKRRAYGIGSAGAPASGPSCRRGAPAVVESSEVQREERRPFHQAWALLDKVRCRGVCDTGQKPRPPFALPLFPQPPTGLSLSLPLPLSLYRYPLDTGRVTNPRERIRASAQELLLSERLCGRQLAEGPANSLSLSLSAEPVGTSGSIRPCGPGGRGAGRAGRRGRRRRGRGGGC